MGDESKSVSEGQFSAWLTPAQARDITGLPKANAVREIVARLRGGLILAAPTVMSWRARDGSTLQDQRRLIPAQWWRDNHDIAQDYDDFWVSGRAYARIGRSSEQTEFALFDIRIDPFGVEAIPKPSPPVTIHGGVRRIDHFAAERAEAQIAEVRSPAPEPTGRRPGRPAKDFWEDAAVAVCAEWFKGQLLPPPARLADVERAFADWIDRNGHSATESVVREHAKKVWDALKD